MGLASSGLLFGSTFLPWMSFVSVAVIGGLAFPVFGVQASLWDLAGPSAPLALKSIVPLLTGVLVLAAGSAVLLRSGLGALSSLAALLVFWAGTGSLFGVHVVGAALTIVAPGPGIEWAAAGLVAAVVSHRFRAHPAIDLLRGLRAPQVLAQVGLFLAVTFVAIDAADHASGGDLFAVFGSGGAELLFHGMFIGGTVAVAGIFLPHPPWFQGRTGSALIAIAGAGLVLDAVFHAWTGDTTGLVGHTGAEILAHVATYYGIALLTISRFVLRNA